MAHTSVKVISLICAWVVVMGGLYFWLQEPIHPAREIAHDWNPSILNAIVLIGASKMASDKIIDYSIASIREYGNWKGSIFLLTDRPSCFDDVKTKHAVDVVNIPEQKSILEIKALKANLMKYLPESITGVLYIDVDIVVTKDLRPFLFDTENLLKKKGDQFDIGMFPDAKGHYVGFCSGCEKWHTGVVVLRRNMGMRCLSEWERILKSGVFDTDQQSIDLAENEKYCPNALALPTSHLMFAKDYLAVILTNDRTFLHMTGAGRMDAQDIFYKLVVLPYFRKSFSKLTYSDYEGLKICK